MSEISVFSKLKSIIWEGLVLVFFLKSLDEFRVLKVQRIKDVKWQESRAFR